VAVVGGGALSSLPNGRGDIWTSTNAGVTWTDQTHSVAGHDLNWISVASDSTGSNLVAAALTGDIWTSTNAGVTWTDQTPSGTAHSLNWASVASDPTGTHFVAVVDPGDIWSN
jgi:hypothetical protein